MAALCFMRPRIGVYFLGSIHRLSVSVAVLYGRFFRSDGLWYG